jgi:hypothetical protein
MLKKLVYRLPSFVLPSWANTPCQPIYIQDMLQIVNACLLNQETFGRTFDCGSPDVFTYKQLISMTAEAAGLKRHFFNLPNIPVWFSKLWVCLISGASSKLVNPLVDSLTTPMLVSPRRQLPQSLRPSFTPIMEAISLSLPNHDGKRQTLHSKPNRRVRARNQVRSIQRLPMPHGLDALAIAEEYLAWLPKLFSGFVYVDTKGPDAVFLLKGFEFELLRLSFAPDRSSTDRQLFYITGGALAQEQQEANNKTYVSDATQAKLGRLEFRECPSGLHLFAAIHDYKPSLPWWIYLYTQALVHKFVMHRFGRYLEKLMRFNPREVAEQ